MKSRDILMFAGLWMTLGLVLWLVTGAQAPSYEDYKCVEYSWSPLNGRQGARCVEYAR